MEVISLAGRDGQGNLMFLKCLYKQHEAETKAHQLRGELATHTSSVFDEIRQWSE